MVGLERENVVHNLVRWPADFVGLDELVKVIQVCLV